MDKRILRMLLLLLVSLAMGCSSQPDGNATNTDPPSTDNPPSPPALRTALKVDISNNEDLRDITITISGNGKDYTASGSRSASFLLDDISAEYLVAATAYAGETRYSNSEYINIVSGQSHNITLELSPVSEGKATIVLNIKNEIRPLSDEICNPSEADLSIAEYEIQYNESEQRTAAASFSFECDDDSSLDILVRALNNSGKTIGEGFCKLTVTGNTTATVWVKEVQGEGTLGFQTEITGSYPENTNFYLKLGQRNQRIGLDERFQASVSLENGIYSGSVWAAAEDGVMYEVNDSDFGFRIIKDLQTTVELGNLVYTPPAVTEEDGTVDIEISNSIVGDIIIEGFKDQYSLDEEINISVKAPDSYGLIYSWTIDDKLQSSTAAMNMQASSIGIGTHKLSLMLILDGETIPALYELITITE